MSNQTDIRFEVRREGSFEQVVSDVTEALGKEGFGVLTRIDLRSTFAEKLGKDFRPYVILGACNPDLAFRAVSATPDVGLLLPCNVVVDEESAGESTIRITAPLVLLASGGVSADGGAVAEVAEEAQERLARVASALDESTSTG